MRVQLMLTCLCDAVYGEVGIAAVRVLEHAGCEVVFPEGQTCCGQPPFNAGDWESARTMAGHALGVFDAGLPIVTPSASCAAMLREGYHLLGTEAPAPTTFELCEFLVNQAKVTAWPALSGPETIVYHRACHGRAIGLGDVQECVLRLVPNLTLATVQESDQCCGFGGAFSVNHGATSREIGLTKLHRLVESGATTVVGGDMGCLMHLDGLARREGVPLRFCHIAEVLASAL